MQKIKPLIQIETPKFSIRTYISSRPKFTEDLEKMENEFGYNFKERMLLNWSLSIFPLKTK